MENPGSYHLLSKFTRLRKKPQQPLSDLTELYGRIANESIYYLKLEEQKDYKAALLGWKALNTDVMYQLTLIDHEYPNSQSYTREETSIKSGVRELYHKSLTHLDRVKKLFDAEQSRDQNCIPKGGGIESSNYKAHLSSRTSSFAKKPHLQHAFSGSSRKMATTLRDTKSHGSKSSPSTFRSQYSRDSRSNTYSSQGHNRVNFTPSKPLVKSEISLASEKANINHDFTGFEKDDEIIDLTQESDEDPESEEGDSPQASQNEDPFDFDFEDYYGEDQEQNSVTGQEVKTVPNLESLGVLERQVTNLSINSPPLIPSASVTSSEISAEINKNRPPIPTNQPPAPPITVTSSSAQIKDAVRNKETGGSIPTLYKSNSTTGASSSVSSNGKIAQKLRPSGKQNPSVKLKATRSTPSLATRHTVPSEPKGPQTASWAAKKVLGLAVEPVKTNQPGQQVRKPLKKKVQPTAKRNQQTAKRPQLTIAAAKKKAQESHLISSNAKTNSHNPNGKANSLVSTTSASSNSSVSSTQNPANDTKAPILHAGHSTTAASVPSTQIQPQIDEQGLKEQLENEIIDSLQGVDKAAAKQIFAEIVVHGDEVHWEDIAGLESAKSSLKEAVVYPFLRPDLFRGLREPVRGMLLFGPPGTGKTMLARAVATESHSTFFSISASSLTSKYLGESEKLVRALFAVAKKLSPSIVFVDEIDSIMGSRNNEGENESSRRIKNEFLIQWSSLSAAAAGNNSKGDPKDEDDERVLVLAATNLPWSIDEAARRRFVRRQYIPLPEPETRSVQLKRLLSRQKHTLSDEDFTELLTLTDGFSGSDITSLAKDAAMGPLRELGDKLLLTSTENIRSIALKDFKNSLNYIKPSVSQEGLKRYEDWAAKFGSSGM